MPAQTHEETEQKVEPLAIPRVAITPEELALRFGKSVTWAYRRIYAGEVKVISGCRPMLIPMVEADRFTRRFLKTAARYGGKAANNGQ